MSARASARTFSARAWLRAVRERCNQGASTTARPARASIVIAKTCGSWSSWLYWATTRPNAAPTRPSPTMTRTRAGHPPRATNGASQTRPPASARQRCCAELSAWRHTRAAPTQAKATGQNSRCDTPSPLVWTSQSSPVPSAARARTAPQSTERRRGLPSGRSPVRVADSRPGASTELAGGISNQSAPYASTPKNCARASPTKTIRTTSTGQPKYCASPVQTPPRTAPSLTRTARRTGTGAGLDVVLGVRTAGGGPGTGVTAVAGRPGSASPTAVASGAGRPGSSVVMSHPGSHPDQHPTSRDVPERPRREEVVPPAGPAYGSGLRG